MANSTYSLFKGIINPLWTISDKLPEFIKISGAFALFLTALAYLFGQTYVCVFTDNTNISLPCFGRSFVYFPYLIIKLLVINIFIIFWLKKVLFNQPFNKNMAAKSVGLFFLFIILNLMPLFSAFLILTRVPNPVWQIELLYFFVVSLGFWIPFVLMRFYAVFIGVLSENKQKMIKTVWQNTGGYSTKIVTSGIIVYMICLLSVISLNSVIFRLTEVLPLQIYNLVAEILFNWMILFVVTLIVNFMNYQKQMFLK